MMREPARGSVDTAARSQRHWKPERRDVVLSLRLTEAEMYQLRASTSDELPTVTDVIRARVFGMRLPPVGRR